MLFTIFAPQKESIFEVSVQWIDVGSDLDQESKYFNQIYLPSALLPYYLQDNFGESINDIRRSNSIVWVFF